MGNHQLGKKVESSLGWEPSDTIIKNNILDLS
jgi:hypothetical protein